MNKSIIYRNHQGNEIDFGKDAFHYFKHGLFDYEWSYVERNGRIASFNKPVKEISFPVGIMASSEEEGIAARNALSELAEADVRAKKPGVLIVGGWEMPCFIIRSSADMYWFDDRVCEFELTVLAENPNWIKKHSYLLVGSMGGILSAQEETTGGDYPFDLSSDLAAPPMPPQIINGSVSSTDFIMRIFGFVASPTITIGENKYSVDISVPNGSRLEINSRDKTILLIDKKGRVKNAFNSRKLGKIGSGNYIFEKIPTGKSVINRGECLRLEVVLLEERSIPEWA